MSEYAEFFVTGKVRSIPTHSRRIMPTMILITTNLVLMACFYNALSSLTAFVLLAITACLTLRNLLNAWDGGLRLDIGRPLPIYSFLFFLYFVLACYMYLFATFSKSGNPVQIAALILVGYLAFWLGISKSGVESKSIGFRPRLGARQTKALLIVCYFGTTMVVIHYIWLAAQGFYFTHASAFEQPTTLTAALWNVFAGSFEYPLVLILGLLSQLGESRLSVRAGKFFKFYLVGILLIYITSGQFRPALTVTIFALLNFGGSAGKSLKMRQILMAAAFGVVVLIVIQAARVMVPQDQMAKADNQVVSSAEGAATSLLPALKDARSEMFDLVAYRATLPLQFLSDIIDAINSGRRHTHGAVTAWTMFGLTPRLLWPEKPTLVPPQRLMERYLDLEDMDNSPGPINYFYTEFGWSGVALGYFAFGLVLGYATKRTITRNSVFAWLLLLWSWGAFAIVDTDLIGGILLAVRQVLVVYVLYRLSLGLVSSRQVRRQTLSSPRMAT
jgi:hypothetical protein